MTLAEKTLRPRRGELSRFLVETGAMSADWSETFEAVDRAWFLPEMMWPFDMEAKTSVNVDRNADPEQWYRYADANVPITTQWDDGRHRGSAPGRVPTSSTSMPSVVMSMLRDLDVREGMKVLEIGTGTGWNAGLLTHRLGHRLVTTVEVDEAVASAARNALHKAGFRPTTVVADGLLGCPQGGPFERIIATVGVRSIPYAWVRQSVPGGLIVAPWGTHYANRDSVARLVVADDGITASGRFTDPVEFMKARTHRLQRARHDDYLPDGFPGDATTSVTTVTAHDAGFEDPLRHPFAFTAGLLVADCAHASSRRGAARSVWLYGLSDCSWAAVLFHDDQPESTVYQSGPRQLWDEVEAAYHWWRDQDRPDISRFGLTLGPEGLSPWLDTREHPVGG
ncbi:protein-L-isoaspartate(D-aspartate) O-methyltransferase [Streptomyces sp. NPDC056244]|uniref:protein-L-isoaspartate(D-aspartate) O-methyltransferase n=1 Tax=unclassified Streptomyces TaxID=2593676 RepID=UPI0035DF283B